jgi:hypothetical protein
LEGGLWDTRCHRGRCGLHQLTAQLLGAAAVAHRPRAVAPLVRLPPLGDGGGPSLQLTGHQPRQLGRRRRDRLGPPAEQATAADAHVRELTLRSLKKRINQFKEVIARFETRINQPTPEN